MNRLIRSIVVACVAAACTGTGIHAQTPGWDAAGPQLSRAELQALLARYEETAQSSSYSTTLREQAAGDAEMIRLRLTEGDLRIGDRLHVVVEGHTQLSDTFNVGANRSIVLPDIGEVPLAGLLRSEIQAHLVEHIGRFIRAPVVHVRSLIRLEILGAVLRPGYYTIPSDMLLTDAIMMAGGPRENAAVDQATIRRGVETIWDAERLREALIQGRTLDQLNIRAGDGIQVPAQRSRFSYVRSAFVVVSAVASVLVLARQGGLF
jgi:protein involved in polysaccharide export with SLBB domain